MKYITIIFLLCSCSTVNKLFHKSKTQIDSTSVTHQKSDSLTNVDSSTYHKEIKTIITKTDSSKQKDNSVITEDITEKNFDTAGKLTKQVDTHRKIENNKVNESSSVILFDNHSRIDSNDFKKATQVSKQSSDSSHVQKKTKDVNSEVHKSRFPVIPVTISILIVALALFIFFYIRRKKKQIEAAAKLIIPPPGL